MHCLPLSFPSWHSQPTLFLYSVSHSVSLSCALFDSTHIDQHLSTYWKIGFQPESISALRATVLTHHIQYNTKYDTNICVASHDNEYLLTHAIGCILSENSRRAGIRTFDRQTYAVNVFDVQTCQATWRTAVEAIFCANWQPSTFIQWIVAMTLIYISPCS